jgi:uncharacterized membrane-anchored protein YitT (DUF2179 family)
MKKRTVLEYFYIVSGTLIAGFAVAIFSTPAKIAGGGVNGISTILYHLFGLDPGLTMLAINIPLFLIGMKVFGRLYGLKSLFGAVCLSAWVTLFGKLTEYKGVLAYTDRMDVLLSAVFGGVLLGVGIGIVMRSGSNTGGTDIIAQILNKYTPFNMGTCIFLTDGLVILCGYFVFGLERAMFAIIQLYLSSQMVNFVVVSIGTKYAKTAYIVSEKYQVIGQRIIRELHHGGTLLSGTGIFTGSPRTMLLAVVHNQQINHLIQIVHEEDPNAFMFVHEAYEVLGQGFVPIAKIMPVLDDEKKKSNESKPKEKNHE